MIETNFKNEERSLIMEKTVDLSELKIQRKLDGTFIVDNNGVPFQITDDYPLGEITSEVIREYIANGGAFEEYIEPIFELSADEKINQQINELKAQLTATDYKVIKAVESGKPLPEEVILERQSIRDEINLLEANAEKLISA